MPGLPDEFCNGDDVLAWLPPNLWGQRSGTSISHRWGGVLGVPRNWKPAVSHHQGICQTGARTGRPAHVAHW